MFDPHQDTALGRLHLVLLGYAKYFWSASLPPSGRKLTNTEKEALERAEGILLSLSQDGLGDRSVRADYVMRYRGSLVGRHLHSITQIAVFLFGATAGGILLHVWVTLGRLCAALFTDRIKDLDTYVVSKFRVLLLCNTSSHCNCRSTSIFSSTTSLMQ